MLGTQQQSAMLLCTLITARWATGLSLVRTLLSSPPTEFDAERKIESLLWFVEATEVALNCALLWWCWSFVATASRRDSG